MTENQLKYIIRMCISELKRNDMIKTSKTTAFQKTEKILYIFPDIQEVKDDFLIKVQAALDKIKDDPDFEIIKMKYWQNMTHEEIAEIINVDPRTITRRKNKLVKRLSFILFPKEAIDELIHD